MTSRNRRYLFFVAAALLAFVLASAFSGLPPLGDYRGPYGYLVNAIVIPERHVTNAVSAVNFDIRGFDTLGEEFIFFTSVLGVLLLMRAHPDEKRGDHEDHAPERKPPMASAAIRFFAVLLIAPIGLFGLYMTTHGQLTPGGGFQGGVILASAPLLIYLADRFDMLRKIAPKRFVETCEALGASAYALAGVAMLFLGGMFLENKLPLGQRGSVTSGGIMPIISFAVGVEVSGGFLLLLLAYAEELMEEKQE